MDDGWQKIIMKAVGLIVKLFFGRARTDLANHAGVFPFFCSGQVGNPLKFGQPLGVLARFYFLKKQSLDEGV